jgi:LuxR family maltose regulon positive regulatory protein
MPLKRQKRKPLFYFSSRLKKQLSHILNDPVTIIEAPSGFGKTTAVREYLKQELPEQMHQYWYTSFGEPPVKAWENICGLFSRLDRKAGERLRRIGPPCEGSLTEIAACLYEFRFLDPAVFVIDNYHLIRNEYYDRLLNELALPKMHNHHFVVITQPEAERRFPESGGKACRIDNTWFYFNREDTAAYFRTFGVRLSLEELDNVYQSTEGWISALQLQRISYLETREFKVATDIGWLLETTVWNNLSAEERTVLVSASVLKHFSIGQVCAMLGTEKLPDSAGKLLDRLCFLSREPDGTYTMHDILRNYLIGKLEQEHPEEFRKKLWNRAGTVLAQGGDAFHAAKLFYRTGDFESLLSLSLEGPELWDLAALEEGAFLASVLDECPKDVMGRHPEFLLAFAFQELLLHRKAPFRRLFDMAGDILSNGKGIERARLRGEHALLGFLSEAYGIERSSGLCKKAYTLLNGPGALFRFERLSPLFVPSAAFLFWRRTGGLESEILCLESCLPPYLRMTGGNGAGIGHAIRAEALLLSGDAGAAENEGYRALYFASAGDQDDVCCAAELTLARAAALRGDAPAFETALFRMEKLAQSGKGGRRTVDLCRSFLDSVSRGILPESAARPESGSSGCLPVETALFSGVIEAKLLLLKNDWQAMFRLADELMQKAKDAGLLLPQVYLLIFLALAKKDEGHVLQAKKHLNLALSLALPDRIYLPFAEHYPGLKSLLESAEKTAPDPAGISSIRSLGERYERNSETVQGVPSHVLTFLERQSALLSRDGLTAKEIADALFLPAPFVKSVLKSAYEKLDVHSKTELKQKEF